MKNIILLLLLFGSSMAYGQAPVNHTICDNRVSTFWESPTNYALPSVTGQSNGADDNRFLNEFDWVYGDDSTNGNYNLPGMVTTFNNPYGQMTNIHPDPAPIAFYMYLYEQMLMSPENGWELLQFNLGRYPNNSEHSFTNLISLPYIIIYNKYSNIIRVFVTYGENETPEESIDGVKIDLSFITDLEGLNNLSGLFRLGAGSDKTLDQTTSSGQLTAVAKNPGFENLWYSADFQIAYDPCTCKYPSILDVNFAFFSERDFELVGNQLTANNVDMATAQELIANDFLGNFEWSNSTKDASNGFVIYDNLTKTIDDYLAKLAEYEQDLAQYQEESAKIKRNKAILTVLKIVITGANPTSLITAGIAISALANNNSSLATDVSTYASDLIKNDTLYYVDINKNAKEILAKGFDFLITKGFSEKPKPEKPEAPSVSYSQMRFEGKLSNDLDIGGTDFITPGAFDKSNQDINDYLWNSSAQKNSPFKYPIYNDVLGTFALLEKPKIKITRKIVNEETQQHTYLVPEFTGFTSNGQHYWSATTMVSNYDTWQTNYQFQIAEELKYALNTNLDIKDYEVKAGFVIETKKASVVPFKPELDEIALVIDNTAPINDELDIFEYFKKNQQIYFDESLTFGMEALNAGENSPFLWGGMGYGALETIQADYLGDNRAFAIDYTMTPQSQINIGPNYNKLIWETELVSKDYFNQAVYSLGLKNELLENYPAGEAPSSYNEHDYGFDSNFDIQLKILVDVVYESLDENGNHNTSTHTFTYKIQEGDITFIENAQFIANIGSNPMSVISEIEDIAYYGDTHFAGQEVQGCFLSNGVYTCQAWDVLNIVGDITTASGYSVNFYAGNEIIELPESSLTPAAGEEIVLEINNQFTPDPIPHVTEQYLSDFCTGKNPDAPSYQANIPTGKEPGSQSNGDQSSNDPSIENADLTMNVYPVPTSDMLTLSFSNPVLNPVIQLHDLAGRLVPTYNVVRQKDNLYTIDVSGITTGTYNLSVKTQGTTFSKRVVIL